MKTFLVILTDNEVHIDLVIRAQDLAVAELYLAAHFDSQEWFPCEGDWCNAHISELSQAPRRDGHS